jgi:hypothetical protein
MSSIPDTPWTQLDKLLIDYVDQHEIPDCEDGDGNTGTYSPTEWERTVVMDAIQGLVGDEEFTDAFIAAHEYTKATRRAAGECERCGRTLPDHWGGCSTARKGDVDRE